MKTDRLIILMIFLPAAVFALDLDLQQAERFAVSNSAELRNAVDDLRLSEFRYRLKMRDFLPFFKISGSSARRVNMYSPDSDSIQLGLSIEQLIFDGGQTLIGLNLQKKQFALMSAGINSLKRDIRNTTRELFYRLLLIREKLRLQKDLLEATSCQLEINKKEYELGAITELDYLETAIEVQNIKLDILNTETDEQESAALLYEFIGLDDSFSDNNQIKIIGSIDRNYPGLNLFESDSALFENIAAGGNLDLQYKKAELDKQESEYRLNRISLIPRLTAEASFFVRGTQFPLQEPGASVSLKINFPFTPLPSEIILGTGKSDKTQSSLSENAESSVLSNLNFITETRQYENKIEQLYEELRASKQALHRNIKTALKQIEHKRLGLDLQRETQGLTERRLRIIEKQRSLGEIRTVDLINEQIDFYSKEISIRENVLDLMKAESEFEKMLGINSEQLVSLTCSLESVKNE